MKLVDEFEFMGHMCRIWRKGLFSFEYCAGFDCNIAEGKAHTKANAFVKLTTEILDHEYEMKEERDRNSRAARSKL